MRSRSPPRLVWLAAVAAVPALCASLGLAACTEPTVVGVERPGADDAGLVLPNPTDAAEDPPPFLAPPAIIPCKAAGDCDGGLFCFKEAGACATIGECLYLPSSCAAPGDASVCACNGTSYESACEAYLAGQSLRHGGSCP